ncbi:MAG: hypothetical protein LH679_13685 [Cyanobacteria bacterium CAN_BIN43]|jgi:hypothetical protein|nr:hypothetical protein [Cyanobacteria bacterium CAN_BIN43]
MVLKFLGIGKKSEFFLEAPPADSQPAAKTEAANPAAPEPSHVDAKAVLAPVAEKISEATSKVKKTLKEVNVEKKAKAEKGGAEKNGAAPTAPATPAPKPEPTLTNFATTLQVNNTPRRRPGPSLNMFKDMAKQVNSRK